MSHQLTALIDSSRIPSEAEINRELERLDLPCRVTGMPSLTDPPGEFVAAIIDREVQRELYFEDARGWLNELPELRRQAGSRDLVIDFRLGADMAECFLVSAVCAALSTLSDALCYYQPDDLYYSPQEAVDEARASLGLIK